MLLGIMHAASPLTKISNIFLKVAEEVWPKIA